jgi:hypothetical protein
MRSIDGRLRNLENRLGITRSAPTYLLVVMDAGRELGPADEIYIKSLDEAGVPSGGFGMVDLSRMPDRNVGEPGRNPWPNTPEISVELL